MEFDRETALNKALALFWRQGYFATSLSDLTAATGLSRSSLYGTFGDKRSLFVECLDLFFQRTRDLLLEARSALSPLDALESFLAHSMAGSSAARDAWGCMMVNTVLECAAVEEGLRARASDHLTRMHALFVKAVCDAGLPAPEARNWADILMTFNEGLRVEGRRRIPPERRRNQVSTLITTLKMAVAAEETQANEPKSRDLP